MAETVTVACKLPHGLRLRLFKMIDVVEGAPSGSRMVQVAQQIGEQVVIRGYLEPNVGELLIPSRMSSWAFTDGVDKEFMTEWLKQNQGHDAVQAGLIFAADKRSNAEARAREFDKLRSGFEPIDPANLPKGIQTGATKAA